MNAASDAPCVGNLRGAGDKREVISKAMATFDTSVKLTKAVEIRADRKNSGKEKESTKPQHVLTLRGGVHKISYENMISMMCDAASAPLDLGHSHEPS